MIFGSKDHLYSFTDRPATCAKTYKSQWENLIRTQTLGLEDFMSTDSRVTIEEERSEFHENDENDENKSKKENGSNKGNKEHNKPKENDNNKENKEHNKNDKNKQIKGNGEDN